MRLRGETRRDHRGLVPKSKRERGNRENRLRATEDTQGHDPPTQKTRIDTDTERRKQINVCINKRQTRATTLDGARVGYNPTGRRTDVDACSLQHREALQDGGAAGSTRAFLRAA